MLESPCGALSTVGKDPMPESVWKFCKHSEGIFQYSLIFQEENIYSLLLMETFLDSNSHMGNSPN